MITIKKFIVNPIQVNTFILHDETKKCVIIDAGCFSEQEQLALVNYLEQNELKLEKLLITHGHFDHILGNKFLAQKYNVALYGRKHDEKLIKNLVPYAASFGFSVAESVLIDNYLNDGDEVTFGNSTLKVLHVPGHSAGSLVYYSAEGGFAIVGDVLFKGSIGRTDLVDGNLDLLLSGIATKLYTLPDETGIFPGHGAATDIGYEKTHNPFTLDIY